MLERPEWTQSFIVKGISFMLKYTAFDSAPLKNLYHIYCIKRPALDFVFPSQYVRSCPSDSKQTLVHHKLWSASHMGRSFELDTQRPGLTGSSPINYESSSHWANTKRTNFHWNKQQYPQQYSALTSCRRAQLLCTAECVLLLSNAKPPFD